MPIRSQAMIVVIGALFLFLLAATIRFYRSVPVYSKSEMLYMNTEGLTLLDRDGNEFFTFDERERKTIIPYEEIPQHVVQAAIAAEDQSFFHHFGFSPTGIVRAAYLNMRTRRVVSGGSTITQQLMKNLLLTPKKSYLRKYQEAVLAMKFDAHFSKEDIMEMYLNSAYFGDGAYGIEDAAQTYFGKSARDITVAESSLLIGLVRAPTYFTPTATDSSRARLRQQYVLRRMSEEGYIAAADLETIASEPITIIEPTSTNNQLAPHFAIYVRDQLLKTYSKEYVIRSGLRVRTTLDRSWQEYAEVALAEHVATIASQGASNGAVVVIDPVTNEVRAMVGSRGWSYPGFGKANMAVHPRQNGSAFKPIVYAAGIEHKTLTAATILRDSPTTFPPDYKPENFDRRYRGRVLARYALANSLNIPTVDAVSHIGSELVANTAKRFGISTLSADAPYNLSIGLGTEEVSLLELTNSYAALADEGQNRSPQVILGIEDKFSKPVNWTVPEKRVVVSPEAAYIVSSILSDNRTRAATFGRSLTLPYPVAVKTGTTQDYRDAWTVGYTPSLVVGVWVGNNDFSRMQRLPGVQGATPLWRNLMNRYHQPGVPESFDSPPGVVRISICPRLGLRATSESGGVPEYFIRGTEPRRTCPAASPSPEASPSAEPAVASAE